MIYDDKHDDMEAMAHENRLFKMIKHDDLPIENMVAFHSYVSHKPAIYGLMVYTTHNCGKFRDGLLSFY